MPTDESRPTDTAGATPGALSTREHLIPETPEAFDNRYGPPRSLASGGMGKEGVRPTYMITRAILEKIFK